LLSRFNLTLRKNASAVLSLVLFAGTQLSAQTQSLGDVAREQKEIRKQHENDGETAKALTHEDLASGSATSTSGTTNWPSASSIAHDPSAGNESAAVKSQPAETGNQNTRTAPANGGSVLDRPKDSRPDLIVVPLFPQVLNSRLTSVSTKR
jgi:hypothetical protein